ncbi:MAG: Panacea domain-containing protein [Candidatus Kaiserbacteria bacterium]|nr:Panacea domain-containing protein [Candidatus Kaiserbacteria bacterium]
MFNYKKTVQAINFFARKAGDRKKRLYKTSLLKLLYFADKKHLRDYLSTISGDSYTAMQKGPVADNACDLIEAQANREEGESEDVRYANEYTSSEKKMFRFGRDWGSKPIEIVSKKEVDERYLSETNLSVLEHVWEKCGDLDDLPEETHRYPEWKETFNKNHQWTSIQEDQMISTTSDGRPDLLGDVSEEELKDAREIYRERINGLRSLGVNNGT